MSSTNPKIPDGYIRLTSGALRPDDLIFDQGIWRETRDVEICHFNNVESFREDILFARKEPSLLSDVAMLIGEAEKELGLAKEWVSGRIFALVHIASAFEYLTTAKELLAEAEAEIKEAEA